MKHTFTIKPNDSYTPEEMAKGMLKVIRESVLIKGEIATLKKLLKAAEAKSTLLDQMVIDMGLTDYTKKYEAYLKKHQLI